MRMLFQSALGACFVRQNGTMSAAKTHSFRRRKKAKWPIGAEPHSNANRSERPRELVLFETGSLVRILHLGTGLHAQ
jgi:hypothetical protein